MSEENQIDSSSKPAADQIVESNQIDSSSALPTSNQIDSSSKPQAPVATTPKWSSMNLLSVNLESLMKQLLKLSDISEANQTEDQTYITRALGLQSLAKQCLLSDNLEMSIFYSQKASRTIDQLYNVRKDKHDEYQVLLAPFYYKKGDSLATYIEYNMDEMNQLKPLNLPEDPDFEGEQEEVLSPIPEEQEEEQGKEKGGEKKEEEDDSQIKEKPLQDDEPQIEEVKTSTVIQNNDSILKDSTIKDSSVAQQNGDSNEFESLSEDIFELFPLALQIINDFIEGRNLKESQKGSLTDEIKKERKKLMSCLLIDCNMRLAEYTKFYQDCANAQESYKKVIELCKEFPEGNERMHCSAQFSLGVILLEMNSRDEAHKHLISAQRIQIDYLIKQLINRGEKFSEHFLAKKQEEQVVEMQRPSVFDDDSTRDMKLVLKDIAEYIRECIDAATINPQLQQMKEEAQKRKEEFGVEGDAPKGFNEKPKDAESFATVTIKIKSKKRNLDDAQAGWNGNIDQKQEQKPESGKKTQKTADDEKAAGTSLFDIPTKENSDDKENKIENGKVGGKE